MTVFSCSRDTCGDLIVEEGTVVSANSGNFPAPYSCVDTCTLSTKFNYSTSFQIILP